MTFCHLLALGGTGAKCLDGFLQLAAAGLGPDQATVDMIDQDNANGNVARSVATLNSYQALNTAFRARGGDHTLSPDGRLFGTRLDTQRHGPLWCPIPNASETTLAKLFGKGGLMSDQVEPLFDTLFTQAEQTVPFDVGYRGKPAVGAAAILSQVIDQNSLVSRLRQASQKAGQGQTVRFFLMGSVFGGTGAAAFPTIARLLREYGKDMEQGSVQIGGVLMLPYFKFPAVASDKGASVAHSEVFLQQTQGALDYYASLMRQFHAPGQRLFDSLYLVGWSPLIELKAFSEGGAGQVNPPLIPELLAAHAACDFFHRGPAGTPDQALRLLGLADASAFGWHDIPPLGDRGSVVAALGQLLRFSHQYTRIYHGVLTDERKRRYAAYNWFQHLIAQHVPHLRGVATEDLLDTLHRFTKTTLRWMLTANWQSDQAARRVNLLAHEAFHQGQLESDGLLALNPTLRPAELRDFGGLITAGDWPDARRVYRNLVSQPTAPRGSEAQGLGVFVETLHALCKPADAQPPTDASERAI